MSEQDEGVAGRFIVALLVTGVVLFGIWGLEPVERQMLYAVAPGAAEIADLIKLVDLEFEQEPGAVDRAGNDVSSDSGSTVAVATADPFTDLAGSGSLPTIWSPTNEQLSDDADDTSESSSDLPLPPVQSSLSSEDVAATVEAVLLRLTQTPVAAVEQPTDVLISGAVRMPDTRAGGGNSDDDGGFVALTPTATPTNCSIAKAEATTRNVATALAEASLTATLEFFSTPTPGTPIVATSTPTSVERATSTSTESRREPGEGGDTEKPSPSKTPTPEPTPTWTALSTAVPTATTTAVPTATPTMVLRPTPTWTDVPAATDGPGETIPPIVPEPTAADGPGQTIPSTPLPPAFTATPLPEPVVNVLDFDWATGGDLGASTQIGDVTVSVRTSQPYEVINGALRLKKQLTKGEARVTLFFSRPVQNLRLTVTDMDKQNGDVLRSFGRIPDAVEGLVWDGQSVTPTGANESGVLVWLGLTAEVAFDAISKAGKIELAQMEFTTE